MQCDQRGGRGAEQDESAAYPLFPVALGPAYVWWLKEVGGAQGESSTGAQRRWGVSWLSWAFQRGAPARAASNLKGALVALSEERNRFRLHSQISPPSTGFYWLEGPTLSATHPPTRGR